MLTAIERKTLFLIEPFLNGGFKSQCSQLLSGFDPTGGMVSVSDQVSMLHKQYLSSGQYSQAG